MVEEYFGPIPLLGLLAVTIPMMLLGEDWVRLAGIVGSLFVITLVGVLLAYEQKEEWENIRFREANKRKKD